MKLSVVILNYNVRYFLQQCLMSVVAALEKIDSEVIVVDNASPDDSCAMVRALFPQVILIENKENSGFPKGNNIGVAAATGTYICILNPDTVVAEDTFSSLLAFAEKQEHFGIAGVKLVDGTGRFLPESKRGIPTPWTAFTKMSGLFKVSPKWFGHYYAAHLTQESSGKVDVLVGAFMFLKRADYLSLGGFDERFYMYGEDIDLSYRMLKMGRNNYYFHETTVIHYKGESTGKNEAYLRHFTEAMQLFYRKHFPVLNFAGFFLRKAAVVFTKSKMEKGNALLPAPEKYFLLSENKWLKDNLSILTEKNAIKITIDTLKSVISQSSSNGENACVLIDMDENHYKQTIDIMTENSRKGLSFRLLHPGAGFGIGSDSSDSRGEVLHFPGRAENNP